jgi:GTP cyclohydrolase II
VSGRSGVLTRLHSECLNGDALGSLRCDCGAQLRLALRTIAAAGEGVLIYATGHEGRGVGLLNKLRAYVEQDHGADTVDANLHLGLPVDSRRYDDAAAVLMALRVRSVRLMTNNPAKVDALESLGVSVDSVEPLSTAPHTRNLGYLRAKRDRLGHLRPSGDALVAPTTGPPDVTELLGAVRAPDDRPFVVLKYAQTLDGRIATRTGDAKWISGEAERTVSHGLRAACDAVLVGVGTVIADDPQLTVRMVPGVSPVRVVLDSTLRVPRHAAVLDDDAITVVITTDSAAPADRAWLESRQVAVRVARPGPAGVDVRSALALLRRIGIESLLVEGGAKVITSLLRAEVVDRIIVGVAPTIIGSGTEAVGDLDVTQIAHGIPLRNGRLHTLGEDVLVAFDVESRRSVGDVFPVPAAAASERRGVG